MHAADGYARSTGKVGVCLVTRGSGATNLVTGIATTNYDSVPLVCFTEQVQSNLIGNNSFLIVRGKNPCVVVVDLHKNIQGYGSDSYFSS